MTAGCSQCAELDRGAVRVVPDSSPVEFGNTIVGLDPMLFLVTRSGWAFFGRRPEDPTIDELLRARLGEWPRRR